MHRRRQGQRTEPRGGGAGFRPLTRGRRISRAMHRRSLHERYAPVQQLSVLCLDLLELAYPGRWLH